MAWLPDVFSRPLWRPVTEEEYDAAHHYVLRILEDFYDQRAQVEAQLRDKGRLPEA